MLVATQRENTQRLSNMCGGGLISEPGSHQRGLVSYDEIGIFLQGFAPYLPPPTPFAS